MAYINKDGYDFLCDINGNPESFVLKGDRLNAELKYILDNRITSIYLNDFDSENIINLDFLKEINFIEKINLNGLDIDYFGIYNLHNLKSAIISVKNKKQYIDYSKFKNLEYLSTDWYSSFSDLSKNEKLEELTICKFKPKSKTLLELKLPKSLKKLEIVQSNIISLEGINLININNFEAYYCSSLESLEGINLNLQVLTLENCKKIIEFKKLEGCKKLEKIIITNCGTMKSLGWVKKLLNLKFISFVNTNVLDGDISPCIGIKYVGFNNYKHYSNKFEEFK
ncbi:hypothetical protein [Flavobacterium sp.]|jgi:protein phosphatase 1 regulatory subunit 7|uniref:hypothetical protein n=1 Tax=Flavobacterium sp. TaxID=239 RepID=UPI0037C02916